MACGMSKSEKGSRNRNTVATRRIQNQPFRSPAPQASPIQKQEIPITTQVYFKVTGGSPFWVTDDTMHHKINNHCLLDSVWESTKLCDLDF